uniref:3-O-methyltransferase 2 n=1 Tax=Phanerochaete chrysosporium (strain RP-78 / ATCC MYA-4764 / FGSC 9002) TaxID=273507 RepID=OMT2_PHACR|nr:RecName: Full=3-O-methyltransferase 2; Short=Mtrase 2 [Phanerochaete chrysosporium RP-78]
MSDYPKTPQAAHLTALVELISSSVNEVISVYSAAGRDIPSLDSLEEGFLETPATTPPGLRHARQIIEAACAQLCVTIAQPGDCIVNKAFAYTESACLQVAANAKISDFLADKPDGLHTEELAKLSGVDAGKLGQVLRFLATKHVYREVRPNVYANNRLSVKLMSSDPVSCNVGVCTGELFQAATAAWDTLSDKEYGPSYLPTKTAFRKVHGATFFEYYETHVRLNLPRFSGAMVGWGNITDRGLLPQMYEWQRLEPGATICDVGGNNGHATLDLVKEYPMISVIVQDLESLRPRWSDLWARELPDAIQDGRTSFVPIDFFRDIPVRNCDVYYIRHILHDWPDASCVQILRNVKEAMQPSSRVLIHEYVLQQTTRDDVTVENDSAPEPLLPNYGNGRIRRYYQDITMLLGLNSKERTLQEFIDIGAQAGLKFVKLWDGGQTALVEFSC